MASTNPPNIVVTCSNLKSGDAGNRILKAEKKGMPDFDKWVKKIKSAHKKPRAPLRPAIDVYQGPYWSKVRDLGNRFGKKIQVSVCSAGYGLIDLQTEILPYKATFGGGDHSISPESIGRYDRNRQWWDGLTKWQGPNRGDRRSLQALVKSDPGAPLVIAGSRRYLEAMRDDLEKAVGTLAHKEQLVIISTGTKSLGKLDGHIVKTARRMRLHSRIGGSAHELNVRLLRYALETIFKARQTVKAKDYLPFLKKKFKSLLKDSPPEPDYQKGREPIDVEDLKDWIEGQLKKDPEACKTPLLRKLRDEAKSSFEQKRFGKIFDEVKASMAARSPS